MTPREKILMAECEKYKKLIKTSIKIIRMEIEFCRKRGWPVSVQLESLTISLEEAIEQVDAVKDGPSEEDKKKFSEILAYLGGHKICYSVHSEWMADQLKKYMGIE